MVNLPEMMPAAVYRRPGEVVVEVRAAGINPGEISIRSGTSPFPATFPSGEGSDLAGVVTSTLEPAHLSVWLGERG